MNQQTLAETAQRVAEHRLSLRPLPRLDIADEAEAYRIQSHANALLVGKLGALAHHKVGATNALIQQRLNVPQPIAGRVFASTVFTSSAMLRSADYVRLGIECEIVLRLGRDLPPNATPYTKEHVRDAIDACCAAVELIDDRYQDLRGTDALTLIADNALDAGLVVGAPLTQWRALDLPALAGRISVNGEERTRGYGADVMGDPLNVAVWLANLLAARGEGLRAGEMISTGSMAQIVWLQRGDRVLVEIERLGAVTLAVA